MAASDAKSYLLVAEAATEIVSQKLEILLSDPVCVGCLLMETRAKDTKAKLAVIQDLLSDQYRLSETTEWWRRLLQNMYYAEEFIDDFHLREARKRHKALHVAARPLATLVSKYMLWRDLSYLVNEMDKLCQHRFLTGKKEAKGKRKDEPASSSSDASVPWQDKKLARLTDFWDQQAPTSFLCHETAKLKIMEQIREELKGIQCTSILGRQGSGKTFLARWVYDQVKYMDYECRAWLHVSAGMGKREFLFEILKQVEKLAREMEDMDINEIKNMLRRKLDKTKKFLLVLDDVQSSDEPLLIELAMSISVLCQSHIIITTQDHYIARLMTTSEREPIWLGRLSYEESQRMLAWILHRVPHGESRLSNEEKRILQSCSGLPLCISLLGGFLSNAREHERAALAKEGSNVPLLDILSCHKLPIHLKPCFIYMALFPVGSPIPTRRLVRLWLAEGLLDSYCYNEERKPTRLPEDVGETIILELANRNVIDVVSWRADGSPKACQMLTSLYDMICPIAMSTGFVHIHATSKSKHGKDHDPTSQQQQLLTQPRQTTKIRWLAEHTNIAKNVHCGSYPDLNLSHVRSLLSFYMRRGMLTKDISTILRKMTSKTDYSLLRVLDLEGVYKPSLHGVLHKLVLIRYLGLRCTVLDSLPSAVADLHYLETLDIKHTNITSLPSSLWKARNLRHLHLNWFYINLKTILKACSNNAMALTKLQTLSGLVIGEVRENLMTGHMDSLTTLKLFLHQSDRDSSGAAGKAVADWISRLTNLRSLTFGVTKKAKPAEEAQLEKNATEVAQPVQEAQLEKYATKVAQSVEEAKEAQPEKNATKVAQPAEEATSAERAKPATSQIVPLPKLSLAEKHHELLELYLLGRLNKPIWTQLLPGSLRVLTLSGSMVELDMLPQLGGLLKNLRTLRLLANSFVGTHLRFIKDGFPRLRILKIWKLPRLEVLIIEDGAMPHLKELELRRLDMMRNVEGIETCSELENSCVVVKKGAHHGVDYGIERDWGVNLYKIEETDTDDEDDRDKKGEMHYLDIEEESQLHG